MESIYDIIKFSNVTMLIDTCFGWVIRCNFGITEAKCMGQNVYFG